jgi:hypothetical protein
MKLFKDVVKRGGNETRTGKFHRQLHCPDTIKEFGSLANVSSGPLESNHVEGAKKPAQRTQKRFALLERQAGERLYETNVITSTSQYLNPCRTHLVSEPTATKLVSGSSFYLDIVRHPNNPLQYLVDVKWCRKKIPTAFTRHLVEAYTFASMACKDFLPTAPRGNKLLPCFTEHQRQGLIFRAHPDYHRTGPWFDWAMFSYIDSDGATVGVEGRIEFFVNLSGVDMDQDLAKALTSRVGMRNRLYFDGPGQYAVIKSLPHGANAHRYSQRESSLLLDRGELSDGYCLVHVDQIADPCCAVENIGSKDGDFFFVAPQRGWGRTFVTRENAR